jgi:hypothetical protein
MRPRSRPRPMLRRPRASVVRSRRPFRPELESVENRWLLTGYYPVTSLNDTNTLGTLRYAITQADSNPGSTIGISVAGTIQLLSALPDLSATMTTISAPPNSAGANFELTVKGGGPANPFSVFTVDDDATVNISGLTIENGDAPLGGGIFNQGTLTLTNDSIIFNTATETGGGIDNQGTLDLINTNVSGNTAVSGGGIYNDTDDQAILTTCSINANSATQSGGGVYNEDGTVGMTNCTLSGNTSSQGGGGMLNNNGGTATLSNCAFSQNSALADYGGGLDVDSGTVTVTGCTFSSNSAAERAGGVFVGDAAATLTDCTLSQNSSAFGGGSYDEGAPLTLVDCSFTGNTATSNGGGIYIDVRGLDATGTTFSGNSANKGGGVGVFNLADPVYLTNCTLSGNTAKTVGGGVYNYSDEADTFKLTLTNCTLTANRTNTGSGGGLATGTNAVTVLNNTLIAGNYAGASPSTTPGDVSGPIYANSFYNLIGDGDDLTGITNRNQGNQIGTTANPINALLGTLGNNGGPTETVSLLPGSPAIDAGNNGFAVDPSSGAPLTYDQRGVGYPRIVNGTVDIGAYETIPPVLDIPTVFRISTAQWFSTNAGLPQPVVYGAAGNLSDIPVPADYLGLGYNQLAYFQPSTDLWYIQGESQPIYFGLSNPNDEVPVPADYLGNGKAQLAIFQPSTADWYIQGVAGPIQFGWAGYHDMPVPADYLGNGKAQLAVYRVATAQWFIQGFAAPISFGWADYNDIPVPGDYLGNGTAQIAVFRVATGYWYINGLQPFQFGGSGYYDVPVETPVAFLLQVGQISVGSNADVVAAASAGSTSSAVVTTLSTNPTVKRHAEIKLAEITSLEKRQVKLLTSSPVESRRVAQKIHKLKAILASLEELGSI